MVDYRKFRFNKLNTPEFSHLKYLIFWPVFYMVFNFLEFFVKPEYHIMHCRIDDKIPFCEYFLIPYLFWFVMLFGVSVYTLLFDIPLFKKFTTYVIITYTVSLIIFVLYPSQQNLRPEEFVRDNILTRFMAGFYAFDTNTNVCPSIHVIGALGGLFALWHSKHFGTAFWRTVWTVVTVSICLSTMFLKQHSFLDIPPALVISFAAYYFVFVRKKKPKTGVKKAKEKEFA